MSCYTIIFTRSKIYFLSDHNISHLATVLVAFCKFLFRVLYSRLLRLFTYLFTYLFIFISFDFFILSLRVLFHTQVYQSISYKVVIYFCRCTHLYVLHIHGSINILCNSLNVLYRNKHYIILHAYPNQKRRATCKQVLV